MMQRISRTRILAITAVSLLLSLGSSRAELIARQHILIVGSSTAYPIIASVAEHFGRQSGGISPVVESTGSGGGLKLFCSGLGLATADIAMASRRMKDSERMDCARNGVNDIREIKIGYDGIVIASAKGIPKFKLSKRDIYLALAREVPLRDRPDQLIPNPYLEWSQVNPALPALPIKVLGPPPTSGTRDIFAERVLQDACMEAPLLRALRQRDPTAFQQRCHALREDGVFVNAGENDARLVRKVISDPGTLGIFGYSLLNSNRDRLRAASIDGIEPRFELIESQIYPLSRPLYLYAKPRHSALVKGLDDFIDTVVATEVSGPEGYLIDHGLIPLPVHERNSAPPAFAQQPLKPVSD
jgi:phosphate transport system substrate-binding protein